MQPAVTPSYDRLDDPAEIEARFRAIAAELAPAGFDIESSYWGESREKGALHPEENYVVSLQFTNSLDWARMVPIAFDEGANVDSAWFAPRLWALLHVVDDEGLPLFVAHGAIFELRTLARYFLRHLWDHPLFGRQVRDAHGYFPVRSCTLLESFAEGINEHHGLKEVSQLLGFTMRQLLSLFPDKLTQKEQNSIRFSVLDQHDPEVIAYACEDAVGTLACHLDRWPRVRKTFIYRVEMQVLPVIIEMADEGVCYDWDRMREAEAEARAFAELYLAEIIGDFAELAGEPLALDFNFRSAQQLGDLLYRKCGMKVSYWTKGGKSGNKQPSVDAKRALPELAKQYPAVAKYLGWKHLVTLCDSFLTIYEHKFNWAADGRAHPALLQHGTIAGRFSCENPNYQQSPRKYHYELRDGTTFDFNFRDCIVAPPPGSRPWWDHMLIELGGEQYVPEASEQGWYILGYDYSQIELRVLAAEAGETNMLAAFAAGVDIHYQTGALMLGKPLDQVTKLERDETGKRMNFAVSYQLTPKGLAQQLGISLAEAEALFAQWHSAFPRIAPYNRRIIALARRDGYVVTKFGRRVTIHEYNSPNKAVREGGDRTAGNAVIQGPATGEYVKVAMVRARQALARAGLLDRVRLAMNIHDALEFYVRMDVDPAEVIRVLLPAVVYPVTTPEPAWPAMVAEWHICQRWGSQIDLEVSLDGGTVKRKAKAAAPAPAVKLPVPEPEKVRARPREGLDAETFHWAVPEPQAAPQDKPRTVIIQVSVNPGADEAYRLKELLDALPGPNTVLVRTPVGEVGLTGTYGLTPGHEAQVQLIFGHAIVHYDLDSVDTEALTRDLRL
jgi:DNA polymerase I-like protein with 3'-5' exonuclease and polymerase domains